MSSSIKPPIQPLPSFLSTSASRLEDSQQSNSLGYRSVPPPLLRRSRGYNTRLMDFCVEDPRSSLEAVLCSCCLVARMYNMLWQQQPEIDPTCCLLTAVCAACPLPIPGVSAVGCGTAYVRYMAYDRLELTEESSCWDCVVSMACPPCSSAQLYRELSQRELWPGSMCSTQNPYKYLGPLVPTIASPPLPPIMGRVCKPPLPEASRSSTVPNPLSAEERSLD